MTFIHPDYTFIYFLHIYNVFWFFTRTNYVEIHEGLSTVHSLLTYHFLHKIYIGRIIQINQSLSSCLFHSIIMILLYVTSFDIVPLYFYLSSLYQGTQLHLFVSLFIWLFEARLIFMINDLHIHISLQVFSQLLS